MICSVTAASGRLSCFSKVLLCAVDMTHTWLVLKLRMNAITDKALRQSVFIWF